jgi:hypothetical protein
MLSCNAHLRIFLGIHKRHGGCCTCAAQRACTNNCSRCQALHARCGALPASSIAWSEMSIPHPLLPVKANCTPWHAHCCEHQEQQRQRPGSCSSSKQHACSQNTESKGAKQQHHAQLCCDSGPLAPTSICQQACCIVLGLFFCCCQSLARLLHCRAVAIWGPSPGFCCITSQFHRGGLVPYMNALPCHACVPFSDQLRATYMVY